MSTSVLCWTPGTAYNYGDVVEYESEKSYYSNLPLALIRPSPLGVRYKILQPHTSQVNPVPLVLQCTNSSLIIIHLIILLLYPREIGLLPRRLLCGVVSQRVGGMTMRHTTPLMERVRRSIVYLYVPSIDYLI